MDWQGGRFWIHTYIFTVIAFSSLGAEGWYLSNGAGSAIRELPAPVAQKQPYALRIQRIDDPSPVPEDLRQRYFPSVAIVEQGELFHRGKRERLRFSLFNSEGRLLGRIQEDAYGRRWVEVFDETGRCSKEEWSHTDEGGVVCTYHYDNDKVVVVEGQDLEGTVLWVDRYRYTRSGTLRLIVRQYLATGEREQLRLYPPLVEDTPIRSSGGIGMAEREQSVGQTTFLLDPQGRILEERQYDEKGNLVLTIFNNWKNNRILERQRVYTDGRRGRTEYVYDEKGGLLEQRDYMASVLERRIVYKNDEEIEELYEGGTLILRRVRKSGLQSEVEWPTRKEW